MRVSELKTKDDDVQQLKRLAIGITKNRNTGRSDEVLAPADRKDIGPGEVRASPLVEDGIKCSHSAMVQAEGG